jgi:hypothetical protein
MTTDPVTVIQTPIRLEYDYTPGVAASEGLRALVDKRVLGQKCPRCEKVYVPPKGSCPRCGIACEGTLELPDTGVVTMFCIVDIPFAGQAVECPYVSASVVFDGADIAILHLLQEVDPSQVRMGMRVQAVWKPDGEREPSMTSIAYFKPTGEPDAPLDQIMERIRG